MDYLKIWPEIERWLSRYTDEERGRVFMAMMAYTFRGEDPDWPEDAREWCVWEPIRDKMDGCADKVQSLRENGRRGGRKSVQEAKTGEHPDTAERTIEQTQAEESKEKQTEANESNGKQTQANESPQAHTQAHTHAQEQAQKENGKRARARESAARFVPPAIGECEAFFSQNGGTVVQATQFHAHYASNGWRVGRNPMKDWHAAARGWIARQREFDTQRPQARAAPVSTDTLMRQSREERAASAAAAIVDLAGEVGEV